MDRSQLVKVGGRLSSIAGIHGQRMLSLHAGPLCARDDRNGGGRGKVQDQNQVGNAGATGSVRDARNGSQSAG